MVASRAIGSLSRFTASRTLRCSAISGFVTPNVCESCPPGLAFSVGLLLLSLMMALNLSLLED